jgi:hypothetical protein
MPSNVQFDYDNQAWMLRGQDGAWRYTPCGHLEEHGCHCYGRKWQGLTFEQARAAQLELNREVKP